MDLPVQAPVAWSPDGRTLAGVSPRDPNRVVTVAMAHPAGKTKHGWPHRVDKVPMDHTDEVTQLAFLPPSGEALVSTGRDGYVRVTSVKSGRTLKKIEVGAGVPSPDILRVSPDGRLVVTVWGHDVVLWRLDKGQVRTYNLNAVRQAEGWPLCVSPDCRYLACRTEDGFDVRDVATGRLRGEFAIAGPPITAAAFDRDGRRLAVGDYTGAVQVFEVITA